MTGYRDARSFYRALGIGVAGYLLKASGIHELEQAIRTVAAGRRYITPEMTDLLINRHPSEEIQDDLSRLTGRHREILQLLAEGKANKEIAVTLNLSQKTIINHRTEMMTRLNVHNVVDLVRFAIRSGVINP